MKPNQIDEQESRRAMRVIILLTIGFVIGVCATVIYIAPFLFHATGGG